MICLVMYLYQILDLIVFLIVCCFCLIEQYPHEVLYSCLEEMGVVAPPHSILDGMAPTTSTINIDGMEMAEHCMVIAFHEWVG